MAAHGSNSFKCISPFALESIHRKLILLAS
jgi:hypothetical protein